jgi:hypothetical protein
MDAIGKDLDNIYKLKDAANYMEIQSLLELICLYMVSELEKCKSTQEVRRDQTAGTIALICMNC